MLIHLHNRAIDRHWSEDNGEGDDDTKDAGGDPGQRRACIGPGGAVRDDRTDQIATNTAAILGNVLTTGEISDADLAYLEGARRRLALPCASDRYPA